MEHQRVAIHAIAQARRLRAIVEDVAKMTAAAPAMHLGPRHAESAVLGGADRVVQRLVEARPTRAALELGVGRKQRQVAAGAGEDAFAVLLQKRARARPLRALIAQDFILLRRELRAPLGISLLDLELLTGASLREAEPAEGRQSQQAGSRGKHNTAVDHDGLRVTVRPEIRVPLADVTPLCADYSQLNAGLRPASRHHPRCDRPERVAPGRFATALDGLAAVQPVRLATARPAAHLVPAAPFAARDVRAAAGAAAPGALQPDDWLAPASLRGCAPGFAPARDDARARQRSWSCPDATGRQSSRRRGRSGRPPIPARTARTAASVHRPTGCCAR